MKTIAFIATLQLWICAAGLAADVPAALRVESIDGPVTSSEIKAFKDYIQSVLPPQDNLDNAMVYGLGGKAAEAMGLMYEVSPDVEVLNRLIQFSDAFLAGRNDPTSGRIVWTGNRELVWPNKPTTAADAQYTGTENGDVIAHIVRAAELILKNKPLWNTKIDTGDPLGYGATYLERAKTYIRECDRSIDTFILPHFVQKGTNRYCFPESPLYGTLSERYAASRGKPVPWNQQAMLNGALQRLAVCHEILGDDAARVQRYDQIVKASVEWFFECMHSYEVKGHTCYKWGYVSEGKDILHVEDMGHASYDMLIYWAYASGRYGIAREKMIPLANTIMYVIARPDGSFAWQVDGSTKKPPRKALSPTFLHLWEFLPELYPLLANASLPRVKGDPRLAATILWVKHQRHLRDSTKPTP